jgi:hypothetical protein
MHRTRTIDWVGRSVTYNDECDVSKWSVYASNCVVRKSQLCYGAREFQKQTQCALVSQTSWTTTLILRWTGV